METVGLPKPAIHVITLSYLDLSDGERGAIILNVAVLRGMAGLERTNSTVTHDGTLIIEVPAKEDGGIRIEVWNEILANAKMSLITPLEVSG